MLLCHMHIDLKPLLNTFLAHNQVIICTLFAFLLASPSFLKDWLAVQRSTDVPATPPPVPSDGVKKSKWRIVALAFIKMVVASSFIAGIWKVPAFGDFVVYCVFLLPTLFSTVSLFRNPSGIFSMAVFRNARGASVLTVIQHECSRSRKFVKFGLVFTAISVAIQAMLGHQPAVAIASTALTYTAVRTSHIDFSFRVYFICFFVFMGVCSLISASIVFTLLHMQTATESIEEQIPSSIMSILDGFAKYNDWTEWFLPAMHAIIPAILVAACLRFDFQNHVDASSLNAEEGTEASIVSLETVDASVIASTGRSGRHVLGATGIVIPRTLPPFSCIYYVTAIGSWLLAHSGLLYVLAFTSLKATTNYQYSSFALIAVIPLMCLSVLGVAFLRGEFQKIWGYKEVWDLHPVPIAATFEVKIAAGAMCVAVVEEKETGLIAV